MPPPTVGPADAPRRYELLERIASGGEGEVWKAREWIDGEPFFFAVKIIEQGDQPGARLEALRMQAAIATHLEHRALVSVREVFVGESPDGPRLYFVMRWINGRSLQEALDSGTVSGTQVLPVLEPIADALDYLHSGEDTYGAAVLHRDVKPANVLIAADGRVYLVDFGLVRLRATSSTSRIHGTAPFMAPESMVRGEFTSATDRYALGATAYYAITGDLPVPGTDERMRDRLAESLGAGNDRVVRGILAMLSAIPDRRPVHARDWLRALLDAPPVTSVGQRAAAPTAFETVRPRPRREPGVGPPTRRPATVRTRPEPVRPDGAGGPGAGVVRSVLVGAVVIALLAACFGLAWFKGAWSGDEAGPGDGTGPGGVAAATRSVDRASPPPPLPVLERVLLSTADLAILLNAKPSEIEANTSRAARDAGQLLKGGLTALSLCSEKSPVGADAIAQASASYLAAYAVASYLTAASSVAGFYGTHAAEYMANVRTHAERCGYQEFAAPAVGEEAFGVQYPGDASGGAVTAILFARVGQVVIEVAVALRARPGTYQADEAKLAAAMAARIPR